MLLAQRSLGAAVARARVNEMVTDARVHADTATYGFDVCAQAVRQMLLIQGVSPDQISTVSFGEERPVAFGSSESDYAQNRRVEFTY